MTYPNPGALVDTAWLADHLDDPNLRIIDATWYLPNVDKDGHAEYDAGHIPGAVFWDIDAIAAPDDPRPHMLPDAATFEAMMAELGVSSGDRIVVYDGVRMATSPRVWWNLRYFGHDDVAVLDGGRQKWVAEGRPMTADPPAPRTGVFKASPRLEMVRAMAQLLGNLETGAEQVLDARIAGRFNGTAPEPRPGSRSGHIPGALNLPSVDLVTGDPGIFLDAEALIARFNESGLAPDKPVVTSCGSGVTACVLALGLHLLGRGDVAVYDGSWSEWGMREDTPIET